jgi:hypothetical protein
MTSGHRTGAADDTNRPMQDVSKGLQNVTHGSIHPDAAPVQTLREAMGSTGYDRPQAKVQINILEGINHAR